MTHSENEVCGGLFFYADSCVFPVVQSLLLSLCTPAYRVLHQGFRHHFYGAKFLRVLCISVAIYPLLFVIIAVFQTVGEGAKPFLLSLLHKGSLDIVLFFTIRRVFGTEYILWATPIMSVVALIVGILLVMRLFKSLYLEKQP